MSEERISGRPKRVVVRIPPGVCKGFKGFKGLAIERSTIVNCVTISQLADEITQIDPRDDFPPYNCALKVR